ncbi:MAG TPA: hypothetical protein G4O03_02125 [Dehalococcoidia bacterium]|jgi:hypothetical protein|nr:hypothetical protein [Dehalococcoidia bacterium]
MRPTSHLIVSTPISAGIGLAAWSVFPALLCLAAGVLIDADHILDYVIWSLKNTRRTFVLILYAWEVLALLIVFCWLTAWNPYLIAASAGYGVHLAADHLTNQTKPLTYLLAYRLAHRFNARKAVGFVPPDPIPGLIEAAINKAKKLAKTERS